jgi:uncharacterized protein (UPF0335 family)
MISITNKIEKLLELTEAIGSEIEYVESDLTEHDLDTKQVSKDLIAIEKHLKKTAHLFTHLKGTNFPDWGA